MTALVRSHQIGLHVGQGNSELLPFGSTRVNVELMPLVLNSETTLACNLLDVDIGASRSSIEVDTISVQVHASDTTGTVVDVATSLVYAVHIHRIGEGIGVQRIVQGTRTARIPS